MKNMFLEKLRWCKGKRGGVWVIGGILLLFALVAFHNLGKFETSDEDLWKDTRIKRYFNGWREGIKNGDWQKTRVNDKPGVTVSLLSGAALPFIADPGNQDVSKPTNGVYLYQKYRIQNTESINRGLRIPIVIFTAGMLAFLGFLVFRWTNSLFAGMAGVALIALNPVLLGISQIINPDAVLWSSVAVSLLLYLISLRNGSWKWVVGAGFFFGWAIASKYTGNLLTVFFLGLLTLSLVFEEKYDKDFLLRYRKKLLQFLGVTFFGYAIFVALVPFVLTNFYFFSYGTFFSPGTKPIFVPMILFLGMLLADAFAFQGRGVRFLAERARRIGPWLLRFSAGALLIVFFGHLINAWTGARFVPLNDLRETVEWQAGVKSSADISLVFPMIGEEDGPVVAFFKKVLVESSYIFFTTPTITVIMLLVGLVFLLVRGRAKHFGFTVFALLVPWVFIAGGLMANVLVNVRYGIIVQPIFGILAALLVCEGILQMRDERRMWAIRGTTLLIIVIFQLVALRSVAPHFLDYQNAFLPKEMSFADSWSYGSYEAAMWLNAQPDARYMEIWSDRKAVCRFFVGKCIRGSELNRASVSPEYFVITRRNVVKKNYFRWSRPELAVRPAEWYYEKEQIAHPAWELQIGERSLNYVKIIRSEDGQEFFSINPEMKRFSGTEQKEEVNAKGSVFEREEN